MPKILPITKQLKLGFKQLVEMKQLAADATSALNRHTTAVRNAMKGDLDVNDALNLPAYYVLDGKKFILAASIADQIDPAHLYEELQAGRITKDQFLRCITVSLGEARSVLGGDIVVALAKPTLGKTVDVRVSDAEVEELPGLYIPTIKQKPKVNQKGKSALAPKPKAGVAGPKRKIKVRG